MTEQTTTTCLDPSGSASGTEARGITGRTSFASEQELWAHKRQQQSRDLENLLAGRVTEDDMSWFSGGGARACRLVNSPY